MHVSYGRFYPETAGLTVESIDGLLRWDDEHAGLPKFGLQSSTIDKAAATVEWVKRDRTVRSGMGRKKKQSNAGKKSR